MSKASEVVGAVKEGVGSIATSASAASATKSPSPSGRNIGSIVLQVCVGLVATYILYVIALAVMRVDKLTIDERNDVVKKRSVSVVDGFIDASTPSIRFNTTLPMANNYMPIRPSVNIKGGAQFTYSFWMYVDPSASSSIAYKTIFLKGDPSSYHFSVRDRTTTQEQTYERHEPMVFCPLLRFGKNEKTFELCFNTLNKYDEVMRVSVMKSDNSLYRNNLISTLTSTWFMITVTFEDNVPINDFENGIQVKFYINDVMYQVAKYRSALKQNNGDLCLFPNDVPMTGVKVSNMKYFNYVIPESDIRNLALAGANTTASKVYMTSMSNKPPVLSDYNKLDIYNV